MVTLVLLFSGRRGGKQFVNIWSSVALLGRNGQFISRETQKDIVNVRENYNLLWIVFRDGDAKRYRPIILNCPQLWIPCGKLPFTCYQLFSGMEIVWKRRTQLWIPSISASPTQSSGWMECRWDIVSLDNLCIDHWLFVSSNRCQSAVMH